MDKWEAKYKFLLTFIKVTHKHIFSDIFIEIREMVVIKNKFS